MYMKTFCNLNSKTFESTDFQIIAQNFFLQLHFFLDFLQTIDLNIFSHQILSITVRIRLKVRPCSVLSLTLALTYLHVEILAVAWICYLLTLLQVCDHTKPLAWNVYLHHSAQINSPLISIIQLKHPFKTTTSVKTLFNHNYLPPELIF